MVGAIILILIAITAGGISVVGLVNWVITGELSPSTLLLGLIATVALSGALIIDGIRFYADKLATQMNYLLMPTRNNGSTGATPATPGTPTIPATGSLPGLPGAGSLPGGATNLRPASQLSSSGANLAARAGQGQRYRIIGKDRGNGMDTELVVQAADQTAALRLGEQKGIDVRRVESA